MNQEEHIFLEGPHSRVKEFLFAVKVFFEFIKGFRKLHFIGPCITVFGSARFHDSHPYYQKARNIAYELSKLGFTIMTGGGPGIMEAANKGAKEAGGKSIGCNIVLPLEQKPNPYLDRWVNINYFFIRKILLTKYSQAFVVMPGGYGTLDEFFESLTLIQTKKIKPFPVVLVGKEYHSELFKHFQNMVKDGTIEAVDAELFLFTDSMSEVVTYLKEHIYSKSYTRKVVQPTKWLGERKFTP